MTELTKKQKFVLGIIESFGLEEAVADEDSVVAGVRQNSTERENEEGVENKSEKVEKKEEAISRSFVRAMVVMKKVQTDGQCCLINLKDSSMKSTGGLNNLDMNFLCVGSVGAAYNLQGMLSMNITHVLCMSDMCKCKYPEQFLYKKVLCRDTLEQDLLAVLEECFEFINDFRNYNSERELPGRILIHCYQGVSRAPSVCAAYMIKFFGYTLDSSLDVIRDTRPQASPNYNFMKSLRILETK